MCWFIITWNWGIVLQKTTNPSFTKVMSLDRHLWGKTHKILTAVIIKRFIILSFDIKNLFPLCILMGFLEKRGSRSLNNHCLQTLSVRFEQVWGYVWTTIFQRPANTLTEKLASWSQHFFPSKITVKYETNKVNSFGIEISRRDFLEVLCPTPLTSELVKVTAYLSPKDTSFIIGQENIFLHQCQTGCWQICAIIIADILIATSPNNYMYIIITVTWSSSLDQVTVIMINLLYTLVHLKILIT